MGKINLNKILEKIDIDKDIYKCVEQIELQLKKVFPYEVFLGGSLAKNTAIKEKVLDVDFFFVYPNEKEIKDTERYLRRIKYIVVDGKKIKFNFSVVHGSRDYFVFPFRYKDYILKLEIVPAVKIKNPKEAKNVIDLSIFHVKYINKNLKEKQKKDVKLLKAFLRASNLYGAESYVKGFSGYAAELLILYYKNFMNLIEKASEWKDFVYIDIEKHYKNKKEAIEKINPSKLSKILLVDPILKERNVLAALSEENYFKFIELCKKFLRRPSKKFFFKEINIDELKKKAKNKRAKLIVINLYSKAKFDVAGAKCLKLYKEFLRKLDGYKTFFYDFNFDEDSNMANIYVIFKKDKKIIRGPPIEKEENVKMFKQKHKNTFVKKGRIFAIENPKPIKKILEEIEKNKDSYKVSKIFYKILN
jgi:tRNA nucleotidyltransferase (CCA-adding enzyme)